MVTRKELINRQTMYKISTTIHLMLQRFTVTYSIVNITSANDYGYPDIFNTKLGIEIFYKDSIHPLRLFFKYNNKSRKLRIYKCYETKTPKYTLILDDDFYNSDLIECIEMIIKCKEY